MYSAVALVFMELISCCKKTYNMERLKYLLWAFSEVCWSLYMVTFKMIMIKIRLKAVNFIFILEFQRILLIFLEMVSDHSACRCVKKSFVTWTLLPLHVYSSLYFFLATVSYASHIHSHTVDLSSWDYQ